MNMELEQCNEEETFIGTGDDFLNRTPTAQAHNKSAQLINEYL